MNKFVWTGSKGITIKRGDGRGEPLLRNRIRQWPMHGEVPPGKYRLEDSLIIVHPPEPNRNAQVEVVKGYFANVA